MVKVNNSKVFYKFLGIYWPQGMLKMLSTLLCEFSMQNCLHPFTQFSRDNDLIVFPPSVLMFIGLGISTQYFFRYWQKTLDQVPSKLLKSNNCCFRLLFVSRCRKKLGYSCFPCSKSPEALFDLGARLIVLDLKTGFDQLKSTPLHSHTVLLWPSVLMLLPF